jgi:predicted DsbA family dithiol-disulfide isomerase
MTTEAPPRAAAAALSRIDVVSDAICPWCWIGKRHLEGALARLADEGERFAVRWRPFQLNPDMPREGVERSAYRAAKFGSIERSSELDAQVAAAGAAAGLEFRFDRQRRTPNTVDAHRLIRHAGEIGGASQARRGRGRPVPGLLPGRARHRRCRGAGGGGLGNRAGGRGGLPCIG